jgi:mannobiose 2-epimerase
MMNIWPANGSEPVWRAAYRELLAKHVVDVWFPRSIDDQYGGFLCNFDRRWEDTGTDEKLLEFQARQTTTAAELLTVFPDTPSLRKAVTSGFEFLRDVMWDKEYGGWYLRTDRSGAPIVSDAGTKHAHGMAYAKEACFAVYAATGDPHALNLGLASFEWIDANARDSVHGGYFGPMRRDGSRIGPEEAAGPYDFIGVPFGLKDMDVNKDMLGALSYASRVQPQSDRIRGRAEELVAIMVRCFAEPMERPWFLFNADWTPASTYWKPSEAAHGAGMLIEARSFTPDEDQLVDTAARMVRQTFAFGWNAEAGALLFERDLNLAVTKRQQRNMPWWAQLELLKAAEYLTVLCPDDAYMKTVRDAARSAVQLFVDERHGGFTKLPLSRARLRDRILRRPKWRDASRKGDKWKDASHDGRALARLACLGSEAPHAGPLKRKL